LVMAAAQTAAPNGTVARMALFANEADRGEWSSLDSPPKISGQILRATIKPPTLGHNQSPLGGLPRKKNPLSSSPFRSDTVDGCMGLHAERLMGRPSTCLGAIWHSPQPSNCHRLPNRETLPPDCYLIAGHCKGGGRVMLSLYKYLKTW
jgi:hypothetical protein